MATGRTCLGGVGVVLAISLAACSHDAMIARFMPEGADERARAYLSLLTRDEIDSATARLVPELRTPDARAQMLIIADVLRGRSVDSLQVIGVQVNATPDARHVSIDYELGDARGWALVNVVTRERDSTWAVEGVTARSTTGSLREATRFRLAGQSLGKYLWILAMIAAAGATIAAAVVVARTRGLPRRWWWVFVALIGIGKFTLNWATGQWAFQPVQFVLLAAGFTKAGPAAPWLLSFTLPVGAALALWRRRRWQSTAQQAITEAGTGPATGGAL